MRPGRLTALAACLLGMALLGGADGARAGCSPNRAPQDRFPVWAPSGDFLAVIRQEVDCAPPPETVLLVSPEGKLVRKLGRGLGPSFSPDSRRVAYSNQGTLVVAETRGRGSVELESGSEPAWGPEDEIAYLRDGALWLADPEALTRRPVLVGHELRGPIAWLPDATGVVLVRRAVRGDDETLQLVLVGTDGELRALTEPSGRVDDPRVTPDGRTLVFARRLPGAAWEIAALDLRNGAWWNLSSDNRDEVEPAVSPDGRTVAFVRRTGPDEGVLVSVALDGPGRAVLGGDAHPFSAPAWSPDGRTVAYASGQECLRWGVYLVSGRGGNERRITNRCRLTGTARADSLRGTPYRDILIGDAGSDRLQGLQEADVILGGADDDVLEGGAGADAIVAGPGADRIYGSLGGDFIVPGTGRDRVWAGRGHDNIKAADGARDVISCGANSDVVEVDGHDVVATDCETVVRRF